MSTWLIKSPTFFSHLDEELFFIGLRLVPEVRKYGGVNRDLVVELSDSPSSDLLGLVKRYGTMLRKPRAPRQAKASVNKTRRT